MLFRSFARECPKSYDVRYMTLDERQDWIEHLLSRGGCRGNTHSDSGLGDHGRSTKGSERARGGFYVSQRVNRTPPLSTSNCFDVLEVYSVEDNSTDLTDEMTAQDVQPTPETPETPATLKASPTYPVRLKNWERRLPQKYVL